MEPIRVSIVFDAQGRPSLQRAAADLSQITAQLGVLSGSSATAGRAFRVMENDLNRFSYALHRTSTQGIGVFNTAFERTYMLFSQMARISFYAAIGQIAAMGFGLRRLGQEFLTINEQFAGLEITLKSMFGSMEAARKVREELARITISSPLEFKDLADAARSLAAMPSLAPQFAQQVRSDNLSDPQGFLRKTIGLLEKMQAFRPDKTTADAVFALREAISGELRSLVRRFEFPTALLVQASGKPLDYLKSRPLEMLNAMQGAFGRLISDQATQEIVKQPTRLIQNIVEQAVQIPLLQIGRAGEKEGQQSLYQRVLDVGFAALTQFGNFANVDRGAFGPRSKELSQVMTRLFNDMLGRFDRLLDKGLNAAGASAIDIPGAGKIERIYFVVQKAIEYAVDKFPVFIQGAKDLLNKIIPIAEVFFSFIQKVFNFLKIAVDAGPWTGLAALVAIRSLPQVVSSSLRFAQNEFIETAQNIRSAVLGMSVLSSRLPAMHALQGVSGGMMMGGLRNALPGTYAATVGRNPFLYNEALMEQSGFRFNNQGQLVHAVEKVNQTGYFGQQYSARAGTFASPTQLPSGMMFQGNQRLEEVLTRNGMAYNSSTGQIVWAPGSGQPVGRPVPSTATRGLLNGLATEGSLPPNTRQLPSGRYQNTITGRFVSENWVRSNLPASVPVPPAQVMRGVYDAARSNGTGMIGSAAAAGTAGLMARMGVGAGASAAITGAVGTSVAGLVSVIGPVLIAIAGSAAVMYLVDKIQAYADKRTEERNAKFLSGIGLDKQTLKQIENTTTRESAFGRSAAQLSKDIFSDPLLRQYRPAMQAADSARVEVSRPRELIIRRADAVINDRLGSDLQVERKFSTTESTIDTRSMNRAELVNFRSQLARDIFNLEKVISVSKETKEEKFPQPVAIETIKRFVTQTEDFLGRKKVEVIDDGQIKQRDVAEAVIEGLRKQYDATTGAMNSLKAATDAFALRTKDGQPLISTGAPLNESEQMRVDQLVTQVSNLQNVGGVIDSVPIFEGVRAGMKAFDLSPDMRQLTESNDSLLTEFRNSFQPFAQSQQVFVREQSRMQELIKVMSEIDRLTTTPPGEMESPAFMALRSQESRIESLVEEYLRIVGTDPATGKQRTNINVPVMDENGEVVRTEIQSFESFARTVKDQLSNKVFPDLLQGMRLTAESKIAEVPSEKMVSFGTRFPALATPLIEGSDSTTTTMVSQFKTDLKQLQMLMTNSTDTVLQSLVSRVEKVIQSFDTIPSADTALMPEDSATIALRRTDAFSNISRELKEIAVTAKESLKPGVAEKFTAAVDAFGNGVTQFTSKSNELADRLRRSVLEMTKSRMEDSFTQTFSGTVRGETPLGRTQLEEATQYAIDRFGIDLKPSELAFSSIPFDDERKAGPPRQREAALADTIENVMIPRITEEIKRITQELSTLKEDSSSSARSAELSFRQASMQQVIRTYQQSVQQMRKETESVTRNYQMEQLDRSLSVMREMTDPQLGFKLSRRGSLSPQTQWQSGRFGQADNRTTILESQFNEFNKESGSKLTMREDFREALEIDTRGFRAVTGEVERLTAFQRQYIQNSEKLSQMADETEYVVQKNHLRDLSEAWAKLADEAERTRESIVGRGGVLSSFGEGFGSIISQWNATAANWTQVGASVAESLSSNMSDALMDIAMNAKSAGEAFRQFGAAVAETAARMAMNKTVETILGFAFQGLGSLGGNLFGGATAGASTSVTGVTGTTLSSNISVPSMSLATGGLVTPIQRASGGVVSERIIERATGGLVSNNVIERSMGGMISDRIIERSTGGIVSDNVIERSTGGIVSNSIIERAYGGSTTSNYNSTSLVHNYPFMGQLKEGIIPGSPSDRDNRLAYVATGEYIIPTKAVKKFGVEHFEAYRQNKLPAALPHFETGGLVGSLPVNFSMGVQPSVQPISFNRGGSVGNINAPVNVTVNLSQNGDATTETPDPETTEERARVLARSLQATVREQLMREQRQGGVFHSMLRGDPRRR